MFLDFNNNFYGKIGGKSIRDFLRFDFKLNACEDRIKYINEVLGTYEVEGIEFYHKYFDEVYNQDRKYGKIDLVLNTSKSTYSTSNIAQSLEKLADYILAVDEKDACVNYKVYTSEELFNKACKEYNLINDVVKANGGLNMKNNMGKEIEEFPIFQLPRNYKKVKDLNFEKEDLEKYPPMKDYYDFYEYLKSESNRLWNTKGLTKEDMIKRGEIKKLLPEIKKDMMEVKKQLQMPIIWKAPLKDSGEPDYDLLDMFDKDMIKELLRVHKQVDLQDDLSCILVDLDNLIERTVFTKKQREVIEMWRNGLSTNAIAEILELKPQSITEYLDRAIGVLIKQYERDYEDWYYLNIRKGTYKRCNKCNEVKLSSRFDRKGKGLFPICKECRKNK